MKNSSPQDNQDLTQLVGVGPSTKEKLGRLKIYTMEDLLLHLPFRYQDRTRSVALNRLRINEEQLVTAEILDVTPSFGRRRSLLVSLGDDTGFVNMRLFHYSRYQQQQLKPGLFVRCFGSVRFSQRGLEMVHPEYTVFEEKPPEPEAELTPVYHTTEGLSQNKIRALCKQVLEKPLNIPSLDLELSDASSISPKLKTAIKRLHRPNPDDSAEKLSLARERIAREEFVAYFLGRKQQKQNARRQVAFALPRGLSLGRILQQQLGFALTVAQGRVITEILLELESDTPMLRLLQGDVGSGKTVVAAFAAIRAAENNYQTAILVPTEILAEQHLGNFKQWLEPLKIEVVLLSGKLGAAQRKKTLEAISSGKAKVVIGTHALFQSAVHFCSLALTIVDEQHRFGVEQRLLLRNKSSGSESVSRIASEKSTGGEIVPHQLVMTATPIPRTLTMTLYADMDVSIIDELPKNRLPIKTRVLSETRKTEVIDSLPKIAESGRQIYWVCTLIEESDQLDSTAAETAANELSALLPSLRIGLVHGRFSTQDKNTEMQKFKAGDIDVLVATTVVEVGVDAPNASLIVIENTERLGLSQLHQLRGRVGRGDSQSHCILLYSEPLGATAKERLKVMRSTNDGFKIAEEDLKLRGPGDLQGTRQTGDKLFRIADIFEHAHLMQESMQTADTLIVENPELSKTIVSFWSDKQSELANV